TADLALALQALDPARLVVGADFSEGMLREARLKLGERRAPRVRLVACDALALPFRSRSFACVMSAFLLRNPEDLSAGLRERRRACARCGGAASGSARSRRTGASSSCGVSASVRRPHEVIRAVRALSALRADPIGPPHGHKVAAVSHTHDAAAQGVRRCTPYDRLTDLEAFHGACSWVEGRSGNGEIPSTRWPLG